MIKKEYMKPTMKIVVLKYRTRLLTGSSVTQGVNSKLQSQEVEEAW